MTLWGREKSRRMRKGCGTAVAALMAANITACVAYKADSGADDAQVPLPPAQTLVLDGATVVDVRRGTLRPDMRVVLRAGMIEKIGPASAIAIDASARTVDAHGTYVVPGFLDMHVHVMEQGHLWESLSLMLANGVTGFRQMSGTLDLLRRRREGELPIRQNQPALLEMPGSFLAPWNTPDEKAGIAQVDEQRAAGADFIKIGLIDAGQLKAVLGQAHKLGIPALGHVPPDVDPIVAATPVAGVSDGMRSIEHLGAYNNILFDCATDPALKREFPHLPAIVGVLPHLPFGLAIINRIVPKILASRFLLTTSGEFDYMRRLEDSYSDEKCRGVAAALAGTGVWEVPTLINLRRAAMPDDPQNVQDPNLRFIEAKAVEQYRKNIQAFSQKFSADDRQTLRRLYDYDLKITRLLAESGSRMLAGTDAGPGRVGFFLHKEFDELASAGLSPLQILQMTTLNGAEYLNRTKTMGAVEEGKAADLVLLDGNPLDSVQNLHRIRAVIRAGYYYSRPDLDALEENVAASVAKR